MCHGRLQADGPHLWLEQGDGKSEQVSASTLHKRLATLDAGKRPLLVVLAACEGASGGGYYDPLIALRPQLARAGIPAWTCSHDRGSPSGSVQFTQAAGEEQVYYQQA